MSDGPGHKDKVPPDRTGQDALALGAGTTGTTVALSGLLGPPWGLGAICAIAAVLATAYPLATFTAALAVFGLAHVVAELAYLDARFGARIGSRLGAILARLPTGAVLVRFAALSGALAPGSARVLELGLVALLAGAVLPIARARVTTALVCAAFLGAAALAPLETLLILAVAHNLTPVGFVTEAVPRHLRPGALAVCAAIFGAIPLAIATGLTGDIAAALGVGDADRTLFGEGPLSRHLHVYVPTTLIPPAWWDNLFRAAVYMQLMHYAFVIVVLPRLQRRLADGSQKAPGAARTGPVLGIDLRHLVWIVPLCAGVSGTLFWFDFHAARGFHSLPAAVHAWIEIPVLLLFLGGLAGQARITQRSIK